MIETSLWKPLINDVISHKLELTSVDLSVCSNWLHPVSDAAEEEAGRGLGKPA